MTDTAGDAGASQVLAQARSVLVIDWPSRDVPATLAAAGFAVTVKGGPGPTDYTVWEVTDGEPVTRRLGHAPWTVHPIATQRPDPPTQGRLPLGKVEGTGACLAR